MKGLLPNGRASAQQAAPVSNLAPPAATAATDSRAPTANAGQPLPSLVELLRTQDNLTTAVLLHEVFGPPRCRRSGVR